MGYDRYDRGSADPRDRDRRDHDPRERGFFDRAGDEVRSWFGDEEAERRRRYDERYDERSDRHDAPRYEAYPRSNRDERYRDGGYARGYPSSRQDRPFDDRFSSGGYSYRDDAQPQGGRAAAHREALRDRGEDHGHDDGYRTWRNSQIDGFDRDYEEFRRENQSRFQSEFATWRQNRQTQRDALGQVKEHQDVVGSDGGHVGTVDHVRSDHILLTRSDPTAGGHHHSIPSSWIASVSDTVTLSKTAEEAKRLWTDAEGRGGLFGGGGQDDRPEGRGGLNRSFSGTYR